MELAHTFVFADLAGFTALTEAHGDDDSTELTHEFFDAVRSVLDEHDAEEVKTIGDAVMMRVPSAEQAVRLGLCVLSGPCARHGFPSVRIGMHTGPATERGGDWFGATVNTAARVAGVATGGEVVVTETTRHAAGEMDGIEFRGHGRHDLKNVAEPVTIFAAVEADAPDAPERLVDPVCRMAIAPEQAAAATTHHGVEYRFCSNHCAQAFAAAPQRYVAAPAATSASRYRAVTAIAQGGSYVGFGLWSLVARKPYRRTHRIRRDDWVLNAHGAWLIAVGATLALAGARGESDRPEIRLLGAGSALGLAVNDVALRERLPSIYRKDLAYELALLGAWLFPSR